MFDKKVTHLFLIIGLPLLAILALITAFSAPAAQAAPNTAAASVNTLALSCVDSSWPVANETELNEAIVCYNAKTTAGSYTITMTQNISLTASTTAISNTVSGVDLLMAGQSFTVDGQDNVGVRPFNIAADTTVTINDLIVSRGKVTGAEQGGGILNLGHLTINRSTISENQADDDGAGIYSFDGTLAMHSSTITNNTSTADEGGGVFLSGGTATITNSTISGNDASFSAGGITTFGGQLTLLNTTIANNNGPFGSGLRVAGFGQATISNSLLADNTGGADCDAGFGSVTDGGDNLIESQSACGFSDGVNGNIVGSDPVLDSLADNGGATKTHALLTGSPAIDAGDTALTTDQRGETRPFGLADDIGAFELQTCFVDSWSVSNEAELNAAIECYNTKTTPDSYTITVTQNISLTTSATTIDNSTSGVELAIEGSGFAVDGQDNFDVRPFYIQSSTTVTINDLTVTGGNKIGSGVENRGGGILNRGTLTLNRSTVISNTAETRGGGLATQGGTVAINDSTLAYNISGTPSNPGSGGGFYNESGQVTVRNSTISGNESDGLSSLGGGISNYHNMTLESVTITDNGASDGGGIYFNTTSPVTLTIKNTILAGNGTDDCYFETIPSGATIDDLGYNLVQADNQLHPCGFVGGVNNNIVSVPFLLPLADNGGSTQTHALELDSPAVDAGDTSLPADQRGLARPQGAADDIGAFESTWCSDDSWSVTRLSQLDAAIACFNAKTNPGTYTINITQGFPAVASTTPIDNSTSGVSLVIEGGGNSANWNGDLILGTRPFHIMADTTVTINDFTIQNGNVTGAEQGGGILNLGHLTINRSTISGNQSDDDGAGIYSLNGTLVINSSTIANNTSTADEGGGVFVSGGTATITNSTISGNNASFSAGGITIFGAQLTLLNTTITNNNGPFGSGLRVAGFGQATISNSLLANNTGGPDCDAGFGFVTDGGHNLIESQSNCGFSDGVNGNIVGSDPVLDLLADNGGATKTHALLTGSPAIDAGDTALTTDQRGVTRPQGLADDIGAYEAQVGSITITKDADPADDTVFNFGIIHENNPFPDLFTLQDPSNPSYTDSGLPVATYLVAEVPMDGWALSAIQCQSTLGTSNFSLALFGVSIELASGDDVTCTFVNECPMPNAPDIDISRSGTQVELAWITAPASSGYNVYRSSNDPYFTPMLPAYANPANSPWLDPDMTSIGDVANNYFYVVQTTTDCNESAESNRVGEFDFTLVPGTP